VVSRRISPLTYWAVNATISECGKGQGWLPKYSTLASLMPDIKAHAADCKFYNCSHLHEPGCGVIAAVQPTSEGFSAPSPRQISANRYKIYSNLFAELSQKRY